MKRILFLVLSVCAGLSVFSQKIDYTVNPQTQAIQQITIQGDANRMNWLLDTSGKQYPWVTSGYGWGLGYFTKNDGSKSKQVKWTTPRKVTLGQIVYQVEDVEITVNRSIQGDDLVETYTFRNVGKASASLSDIGIYMPFNDNYPDAETCVNARANAHIWDLGYNAAYVNVLQMGGKAPHLGVMLEEGIINGYEIAERDIRKGMSNFRGVMSLTPQNMTFSPGESRRLSFRIFSHQGGDDFYTQLLKRKGVYVECDKYVIEKGDHVKLSFYAGEDVETVSVTCNGEKKECSRNGNQWTAEIFLTQLGENLLEFAYGNGKKTYASCLVVSGERKLLAQRAHFIIDHQQMKDKSDARYGAYMVYDCENDKLFLNDVETVSYHDRDEGAERLGMGVFLAKQYLLTGDDSLKKSLMDYVCFVRNRLQDKDFTTWSTVDHKGRNRAYNYPWVANLYFYMYKITKDGKYAKYGYETMQAMLRYFGYNFYAIDIPVSLGLSVLKEANLTAEYQKLKSDYLKIGETYLKYGTSYPKHEVNYEQSIVAPAVMVLSQLYLETKDMRYLDEAKRQMKLLDSFSGLQPSFHLNDIAIRHWDGYWFGKREMWGDVFPHYWSTLSAAAYYYYYLCIGDEAYSVKAKNIVRNNLCLFFENGEASCAYLYPKKVNGKEARFYDSFANDQDWALVYYILVNDNI